MKEIECTTENVVIFVILYLVLYYITALVVMFFNKKIDTNQKEEEVEKTLRGR